MLEVDACVSRSNVSDGCRYFIDCCRELFRLEDDGYTDDGGQHDGPECSIMFRKGDRSVLMLVAHVKSYGMPTVQIRPPDPDERFGLHEAIPAVDPQHHTRQPGQGYRMSASQLRALLEHYAAFFDAHRRELLEDHGAIFAAVKRRRRRE